MAVGKISLIRGEALRSFRTRMGESAVKSIHYALVGWDHFSFTLGANVKFGKLQVPA